MAVTWDILPVACHPRHGDGGLECKVEPGAIQHRVVDVFAPVGPLPLAFPVHDQSVGVELPDGEVVPDVGINFLEQSAVAGVPVVGPEAIPANAGAPE